VPRVHLRHIALPSVSATAASHRCHGRFSQAVDPAQDRGKQRPWHRDLGQLEHHVAAVAHDPGADLDELLAQGSAPPATPPSTGTGVVTFLMG